jgi:uncharacterized short protein YbdD (DUF466 family)
MRSGIEKVKHIISMLLLIGVAVIGVACSSEFDKYVETKQDRFKREHPTENWENLVRAREQFQQECRQ